MRSSALALCVLALFACPTWCVHAQAPLRLVLRVASENDRALLPRLRGQLSDTSAQLVVVETAPLEAALSDQLELANKLAQEHDADALVWCTSARPAQHRVHILLPRKDRILSRELASRAQGPFNSSELETAALLVRSAMIALAQNAELGQPTPDALAASSSSAAAPASTNAAASAAVVQPKAAPSDPKAPAPQTSEDNAARLPINASETVEASAPALQDDFDGPGSRNRSANRAARGTNDPAHNALDSARSANAAPSGANKAAPATELASEAPQAETTRSVHNAPATAIARTNEASSTTGQAARSANKPAPAIARSAAPAQDETARSVHNAPATAIARTNEASPTTGQAARSGNKPAPAMARSAAPAQDQGARSAHNVPAIARRTNEASSPANAVSRSASEAARTPRAGGEVDEAEPELPAGARASAPLRARLALGAQLAVDGQSSGGQRGLYASAGLGFGSWVLSAFGAVSLASQLPDEYFTLSVARHAVGLAVERQWRLADAWSVGAAAQAGALLLRRTSQAKTSAVVTYPASLIAAFAFGPELALSWLRGPVGFALRVGVDILPNAPRFESTSLSPQQALSAHALWTVQPRIALGWETTLP